MDDHDDFARVMRENKRGANDFWYWKDKPVMEAGSHERCSRAPAVNFNNSVPVAAKTRLIARPSSRACDTELKLPN